MSKRSNVSWIPVVSVILVAVIAFQLFTVNKHLDSMDAKLGTLDDFFSKLQAPGDQAVPQPSPVKAPARNIDMKALVDDDPVKGDADAPVTIVEFSDFQCPFCGRFYQQTLPQIMKEYVDTGKVKFVYRDFPLSFHENAQKAAEAGECAHEQGKFWEMHDKIFENQASLGVDNYKKWASDLGLDSEKFNDCLDSGKFADEISKDLADGAAAGVSGTPGFIINGKLVSGAQPFAVFKSAIEAELK